MITAQIIVYLSCTNCHASSIGTLIGVYDPEFHMNDSRINDSVKIWVRSHRDPVAHYMALA